MLAALANQTGATAIGEDTEMLGGAGVQALDEVQSRAVGKEERILTQLLNERTRTARFSRRNLESAGGVEKEVVLVGDAAENPAARQQAGRS
jgi:hypothetical protein